jgi:hypothetical protein
MTRTLCLLALLVVGCGKGEDQSGEDAAWGCHSVGGRRPRGAPVDRLSIPGAGRRRDAGRRATVPVAQAVLQGRFMSAPFMRAPGAGRWGAALAACLFGLFVSRVALAGSCPNVNIRVNSTVPRYYPGGNGDANLYPFRPGKEGPAWIDVDDCNANINLEFTLEISGLPCKDTIQVWAGTKDTDCIQTSARQAGSGAGRCWPVTPPGAFALAATSTGNIRAEDIVAFLDDADPPATYSAQGASACSALTGTYCGAVPLHLFFLAVEEEGGVVDGVSAEYIFGAETGSPDGGWCQPDSGLPSNQAPPASSGCSCTVPRESSGANALGALGLWAALFAVLCRRR